MSITDSANLVRQQLGTARSLAEQSGAAFAKVEADTGAAGDLVSNFSGDVYSASGDDESTNSAAMGASALKGLGPVAAQHGVARTDLGAVKNLEAQLSQALRAAMSAARALPVGDTDRWFVTNPLDSAQTESNEAADSSSEVARSLSQAENAIGYAKSSATAVSRDGENIDVSFEGGRLYSSVDDLEDSLRDAGQSAGHGNTHQGQVVNQIDRALAALDGLEKQYQDQSSEPVAVTPIQQAAPTWSQPAAFAPRPVSAPSLFSAPVPPSPPVVSPAVERPQNDGFFTRPWQG